MLNDQLPTDIKQKSILHRLEPGKTVRTVIQKEPESYLDLDYFRPQEIYFEMIGNWKIGEKT